MMDPDATLQVLRDAIVTWGNAETGSRAEHEAAERATSAASALDDWLSHGRPLPDAWKDAKPLWTPPPERTAPVREQEYNLSSWERGGDLEDLGRDLAGMIREAEDSSTITWLNRTEYNTTGAMGSVTRRVAAIVPAGGALPPDNGWQARDADDEPDEDDVADAVRTGEHGTEVDVSDRRDDAARFSVLMDAIDAASDQDRMTWITIELQQESEHFPGARKRIAAIVPVDTAQVAEVIQNPAYVIQADSGPVRVAEVISIRRMPDGALRMWVDGNLFEYGTVEGFTWSGGRVKMPAVTLALPAMRVTVSDSLSQLAVPEHPHGATSLSHWHEDDGTVRQP